MTDFATKRGPWIAFALVAMAATAVASPWAAACAQNAGESVGGATAAAPYKTELIVRTVNNFSSHADVVSFFDMAAEHGVGAINLAAKQDEDDEVPSGAAFYASKLAPRAKGYETFDALRDAIAEAHRRDIKVRAWVPQFHDQMAARRTSSWQMQALVDGHVVPFLGVKGTEYFVNPLNPAVQSYERSIIAEIVRNYDVDGIVLDWLRFDDYGMDVGAETQAQFKTAFGYDLLTIDFSTDNERRSQWNGWRSAQIGAYVGSVRQIIKEIKPNLSLGVYILPPSFVEVGQDAAQFSRYVDFLSPMAYLKDWGFGPDWVDGELLPQTKAKASGVTIVPVFDEDLSGKDFRKIEAKLRKDFSEISTLAWFVYGKWTEESFERINRLQEP